MIWNKLNLSHFSNINRNANDLVIEEINHCFRVIVWRSLYVGNTIHAAYESQTTGMPFIICLAEPVMPSMGEEHRTGVIWLFCGSVVPERNPLFFLIISCTSIQHFASGSVFIFLIYASINKYIAVGSVSSVPYPQMRE